MRIFIFGKADIFGNIALNRLLEGLTRDHVVDVLLSDHVVDCERQNLGQYLVAHERDFPLEVFFPQVDALGSPEKAQRLTFEGLRKKYGLELPVVGNVNKPDVVERVRAWKPDVVISCRHDYVFKQELISIPSCGFYNLHPGELPTYRGLSATFWTMLDGKSEGSCAFYQIDPGIDTGPVVENARIPLDYSRSLFWNISRVYLGGIAAFLGSLTKLCTGPLPNKGQDHSKACYFSSPSAEDYENFLSRGNHLLLEEDYMDILATYLPEGRDDPLLHQLRSSLPHSAPLGAMQAVAG